MSDYTKRFEALCLNSISLPGKYLEDTFLQGLKPNLQSVIRQLKPNRIIHMMDLVQWFDEGKDHSHGNSGTEPITSVVRMSELSISRWENTVTRHQKPQEELMSLIMVTNKRIGVKEEFGVDNKNLEIEKRVNNCFMICSNKDKRLKVFRSTLGYNVVVLIDYGEINNFILEKLAVSLKLPIRASNQIPISMVPGQQMQSKGCCHRINLLVQEVEIMEDYLVLDIIRAYSDLILGYNWLSKLGEILINWNINYISFLHNSRWVTIGNKMPRRWCEDDVGYHLEEKVFLRGGSIDYVLLGHDGSGLCLMR